MHKAQMILASPSSALFRFFFYPDPMVIEEPRAYVQARHSQNQYTPFLEGVNKLNIMRFVSLEYLLHCQIKYLYFYQQDIFN